MKRIGQIGILFIIIISMVGCGKSKDGKKEIVVGISPDYPPYESLKNNDEIEGFDIDVMHALITSMNEQGGKYKVSFEKMSFDTIITSVNIGQIDLGMSGFSYDKKRRIGWSNAYTQSRQVILVNENSKIKSVSDLKGKKVGAQLGSTCEKAANDIRGASVTTMKDVKVLVETLHADGLDALVLDDAVAKNYVAGGNYTMLEKPLVEEEYRIITKEKGNEKLLSDLNKAIDSFVKTDAYQKLKEKWGV